MPTLPSSWGWPYSLIFSRPSLPSAPVTLTRRSVIALSLLTAALLGCGGGLTRRQGDRPLVVDLRTLDGNRVRFAEFLGKPLVLHLFTVGSMAAQADVLQLNRAHEQGVAVVGVAMDPTASSWPAIRAWASGSGARYPVLLATPELVRGGSALGRIRQVPTTIILDADGYVVFRRDRQLARNELSRALAELP
jgi:hypothetical protein